MLKPDSLIFDMDGTLWDNVNSYEIVWNRALEILGYDTRVTFGAKGRGLTHTILHDEEGPIGAVTQSLTVRPLT